MSERSRRMMLSIGVFAIPTAIVLLSVGTLDSGAGAIAAPGAVSSTGTQQSGSTTAIGGPLMAGDACWVYSPIPLIACDCNTISCQCEDGACVGNRKFCNTKRELRTANKGYLVAIRVEKKCFTVYPCKPEDELESRSACGPGNPCMTDWDNPAYDSETTYYTFKLYVECGGIPTGP